MGNKNSFFSLFGKNSYQKFNFLLVKNFENWAAGRLIKIYVENIFSDFFFILGICGQEIYS